MGSSRKKPGRSKIHQASFCMVCCVVAPSAGPSGNGTCADIPETITLYWPPGDFSFVGGNARWAIGCALLFTRIEEGRIPFLCVSDEEFASSNGRPRTNIDLRNKARIFDLRIRDFLRRLCAARFLESATIAMALL